MTEQEWMHKVKENKDKLTTFLIDWHPKSLERVKYHELPITAPNAERACEQVRQKILNEGDTVDPVKQFNERIEKNDILGINILLIDAWFGVPESTDCWNLIGFREAVDLMDDLPEGDD